MALIDLNEDQSGSTLIDLNAPEKKDEGGFVASAKQAAGATIKGVGRAAADYIPGVTDENAFIKFGQSIIDSNPTAVKEIGDIADSPWTAVKEATGNAASSMAQMLGVRAAGQAITAVAPLTGPFAPAVALAGQIVAWGGPAAIAALPSYGSIREKQILDDPAMQEEGKAKAVAALGAAAVGAIETRFGPQNWALAAMTKEGRAELAEKLGVNAADGFLKRAAKLVGKGAAIEGAEELAQNPIEQLASFDDPTSEKNVKDTLFGGVMGAIGGGVIGGGFAVVPPPKRDSMLDILRAKTADEAINAALTAPVDDATMADVVGFAGGEVRDPSFPRGIIQAQIDAMTDPAYAQKRMQDEAARTTDEQIMEEQRAAQAQAVDTSFKLTEAESAELAALVKARAAETPAPLSEQAVGGSGIIAQQLAGARRMDETQSAYEARLKGATQTPVSAGVQAAGATQTTPAVPSGGRAAASLTEVPRGATTATVSGVGPSTVSVEQSGDAQGNVQQLRRGESASPAEALPQVPLGGDAKVAPQAQRDAAGGTDASERTRVRERISQTGETYAQALRAVRGGEGADAPRRLQQAASGAVDVRGVPQESARGLARVSESLGSEATPVPEAEVPHAARSAAKMIKGAFKKNVVFMRVGERGRDAKGKAKWVTDGLVLPSDPDTVYVNLNSNRKWKAVIGHEVTHALRRSGAKASKNYDNLRDSVMAVLNDKASAWASKKYSERTKDIQDEEVVANIVGDTLSEHMHEPGFWLEVFKHSGSARDLFRAITSSFDKLSSKLSGDKFEGGRRVTDARIDYNTKEFVKDAKAVRSAVAKAYAEWEKAGAEAKKATELAPIKNEESPDPFAGKEKIDGSFVINGVTADLVGERGKYVEIYEWSGTGEGRTRAALAALKKFGGRVVVNNPGRPENKSYAYWTKMLKEGRVDEVVNADGNDITEHMQQGLPWEAIPQDDAAIAVNDTLTTEDKAIAAKALGDKQWSDGTTQKFIEKYAAWLHKGAKDVTSVLGKLFLKVFSAAKAGMMSIAVAFNFNIAAYQSPVEASFSEQTIKSTVEKPRADFKGEEASAEARLVADWYVRGSRHGGNPFIIADKTEGFMYAFDAKGVLLGKSAAIFGKTRGDVLTKEQASLSLADTTDKDKITPAGEFDAKPMTAFGKPAVRVAQYETKTPGETTSIVIHSVYLGTPSENRMARLQSDVAGEKRISYGCINAPEDFIDNVIAPHFKGKSKVVIVPEMKSAAEFFKITDDTTEEVTETVERKDGRAAGDAAPQQVGREESLQSKPEDQTDTPAFKKWFGDSKVVDKNGDPLVVYHGTATASGEAPFVEFGQGHEGAMFFTTDKKTAREFARWIQEGGGGTQRIVSAFLSIKNPKVLKPEDVMRNGEHSMDAMRAAVVAAKKGRYDGIYIPNIEDMDRVSDQWVTFKPEQIKSATDNSGAFDPKKKSILESKPADRSEEPFRPANAEDMRKHRIPPGWTDVYVAANPDADLIAIGTDARGRTQYRYSDAHTSQALREKFERLRDFALAFPDIMERIRADAATSEEAAVLRLIAETGFRIGAEEVRGAVEAIGATTLRAEHVTVDNEGAHFSFPGKRGIQQDHDVTDAAVVRDIEARLARGNDNLFDTNDSRVRHYLRTITGGKFKVHDFRTWVATDTARGAMEEMPTARDPAAFWENRDRALEAAARKIGDTVKVAEEVYVDELIFQGWRQAAGVDADAERPRRVAQRANRKNEGARGVGELRDGAALQSKPADQDAGKSAANPIVTARQAVAHDKANPLVESRKGRCHQLTWRKVIGSDYHQIIGVVNGFPSAPTPRAPIHIWHSVAYDPKTGNIWEPISNRWYTPAAMKAFGFAPVVSLTSERAAILAARSGKIPDQQIYNEKVKPLRGADQDWLLPGTYDADWSLIERERALESKPDDVEAGLDAWERSIADTAPAPFDVEADEDEESYAAFAEESAAARYRRGEVSARELTDIGIRIEWARGDKQQNKGEWISETADGRYTIRPEGNEFLAMAGDELVDATQTRAQAILSLNRRFREEVENEVVPDPRKYNAAASRYDPKDVRRVLAGVKRLGKIKGIYLTPKSDKESFKDVLTEVIPDNVLNEVTVTREDNERARYAVTFKNGKVAFVIWEKDDKFAYMDQSNLDEGSRLGSYFYPAVANWAHNNNVQLGPDPNGFSPINVFRKTEQMLSAALKAGRTWFMLPYRDQKLYGWVSDPKTKEQEDNNLAALALTAMENTYGRVGKKQGTKEFEDTHVSKLETVFGDRYVVYNERGNVSSPRFEEKAKAEEWLDAQKKGIEGINGWRYNFFKKRFETKDGEARDMADLRNVGNRWDARKAGIGPTTIARAVFIRSIIDNVPGSQQFIDGKLGASSIMQEQKEDQALALYSKPEDIDPNDFSVPRDDDGKLLKLSFQERRFLQDGGPVSYIEMWRRQGLSQEEIASAIKMFREDDDSWLEDESANDDVIVFPRKLTKQEQKFIDDGGDESALLEWIRDGASQKEIALNIEYEKFIDDEREREENAKVRRSKFRVVKEDALESKPAYIGADPVANSAARKAGIWRPEKPFRERVKEQMPLIVKRMRQGIVDQFAPIKEHSYRAYMMARMSKGADGALEAMFLYGKPYVEDGALNVDLTDGGLTKVLQKLGGEHDRFIAWIAGNRAAQLKTEGRERLFEDAEIDWLKNLNRGSMPDGRSRAALYAEVHREFNAYSKAVLDVAETQGLIDPESRAVWEKDFYVPFYRNMDNEVSGPTVKSGLVSQQAFKRLKGGKEELNDLLANTLQNWSHLLSAAMKNKAALATMEAAVANGAAIEVPNEYQGKQMQIGKVMKALDNGAERYFVLEDPFLVDAISSLESFSFGPVGKLFETVKRWLTIGVTANPSFKIRNLIRDSVSAIGVSELGYNPFGNVASAWADTAHSSQTRATLLASGGIIRFGTQLEGSRAEYVRDLIAEGVPESTILDTKDKVTAALKLMWDRYQEFGDRGENVNRTALYKKLRAEGKDHLEASFAARDLMDFSMQGTWRAIRFLSQTVPFFNARLQGLYKGGRGAVENPQRMGYVIGAVAMASIALMLAYNDDEDWKKREDFDRDNFWWFKIGDKAFRIPKPFEIGAIGTMAERMVEYAVSDEMTGKRLAARLAHLVGDNLAMNPIPQIARPLIELYANKDFFRGRPIETMGMEKLSPSERIGRGTSGVAQALGKADVLSPVQIDHVIRAYFGWLGTAATTILDYGMRPAMGLPARPEATLKDAFVVGNFIESLPTNSSRYVTEFYESSKKIEKAYADWRHAIDTKQFERAKELREEGKDDIALHGAVTATSKQLAAINKLEKMIESDRTMSPEEKRKRLDRLDAVKNQSAKRHADLLRDRRNAQAASTQ